MWSQRRASFPHTSSRPGIDFSYFFQIKNQNIFKHENCRMYLVSSRLFFSSFSGKENNNNHYHYHNKKSDRDAKELVSNATLRIPRQRLNRPTVRATLTSRVLAAHMRPPTQKSCDVMRCVARGEREKRRKEGRKTIVVVFTVCHPTGSCYFMERETICRRRRIRRRSATTLCAAVS